ncbi:hypothetical protein HC928_13635, partial [bacterium]|nr:hypothetical protein [bacterium]
MMQQYSYRRGGIIVFLGSGLLWACNSIEVSRSPSLESANRPEVSTDDCPAPATALPEETTQLEIAGRQYVSSRFDYAPQSILLKGNTVRFLAREYDFVYCRKSRHWTVQPGTLGEEWIVEQSARFTDRPDFSILEVEGDTYQYRVVRDAASASNAQDESVVLELLIPGQEKPQRHTLYTLADVQQANGSPEVGAMEHLGIPYISVAKHHGERIWWTVAFEQGEGNNGIATIVNYQPANDEMTLIQPDELWSQQILDLVFTGEPEQPTLWMGLKRSSEGIRNVPAAGLVAYQPTSDDFSAGTVTAYTPYNSPLVGAIPTQLAIEGDQLWVGTRNGVCQLAWQVPEVPESWNCWQFVSRAIASPGTDAIPIYPSLLGQTPATTLPIEASGDVAEVLWWMVDSTESQRGRYEVRLAEGFEATIDQGASPILEPQWVEIAGRAPIFWPGYWWVWQGDRFVRPLDHHLDNWIAGDRGIGPTEQTGLRNDWYAIRGDLELLELSAESARVKYYSGWVDDSLLIPFPAVVEHSIPKKAAP